MVERLPVDDTHEGSLGTNENLKKAIKTLENKLEETTANLHISEEIITEIKNKLEELKVYSEKIQSKVNELTETNGHKKRVYNGVEF